MKQVFTPSKRLISQSNNIKTLRAFKFSELVKKQDSAKSHTENDIDILNKIAIKGSDITTEQLVEFTKMGIDVKLSSKARSLVNSSGFYFSDSNSDININVLGKKGILHMYLKNMLLLQEYDTVFRDFLQCLARYDFEGLKLVCEPRLLDYLRCNVEEIKKIGYQIEIEDLKIKQDYKVLDYSLYKNLRISRYANLNRKLEVSSYLNNKLVIAREPGEDISMFNFPNPFVFATTLKVSTPMKLGLYNQNLSKKIYGENEGKSTNYVVRFEAQFTYSDFHWILPTQNKPSRLRRIKITDFNNILRGNPIIGERFDLVGSKRSHYMEAGAHLDLKCAEKLANLDKIYSSQANPI